MTAPNQPAEFTLYIDRADTRPIAFEFASTVNATELLNLTGSVFELRFYNPVGDSTLTLRADPVGGIVTFEATLEQRELLTPGANGRFEIARLLIGNIEIWGRGNTIVRGTAHG